MTQQQIADALNMNRMGVMKTEKQILKKLRKALDIHGIKLEHGYGLMMRKVKSNSSKA